MPIYSHENKINNIINKPLFGDMMVKFEIIFPKFIEPSKKEELTKLLEENEKLIANIN